MNASEPLDQFASSVVREAWETFRRDPGVFIISYVVLTLVSAVSFGVLSGAMGAGYAELTRRVMTGETVSVSTLFSRMDRWVAGAIAMLAFALMVGVGIVMLVVPGLLAILMFAFSVQVLAFENTSGIESLKRSYALVRPRMLEAGILLLMVCLANWIGAKLMFIGMLLTAPLGLIVMTLGYERLRTPVPMQTVTI